jgi:lysophospholipase L1-like esterase
LAGDSTVANGTTPCPVGWGKLFKPFFNGKVTVKNSAVGGTSLHTWLYTVGTTKDATGECTLTTDATGAPVVQAHWQEMLDHMKTGDYLFIQFGINDGGDCPRYEGDAQFQKTLGMMAMAAKTRGASPVFVTPVSSISCRGAAAVGTRGRFVTDTKTAATTYGVPVIDLEALSVALYTASGFCPLPGGATDVSASTGGAVGAFFCDDHTHFEMSGAMSIAQTMADAVRVQLPGLAGYLN